MSYGKKIIEFFQQLDYQKDDAAGEKDESFSTGDSKIVEKTFDNVTVKIKALDFDKYSCVISGIEVKAVEINSTDNLLQSQANHIIDKIDYLTETFALIELDERNAIAQIRSHHPPHKAEAFEYFEILLTKGAQLSFQRYKKYAGEEQRNPIPVILSHELLERLIDDFLAMWQKQ